MRIIIVAGADRNGKTVLTNEFIKNGYIYKHFGPPAGSPYKEYMDYADWLMKYGDRNGEYIIDRYMYCEFAYSKHYRRKTDMTIERMHEIERDLLKLDIDATVIYCATDIESNWKRIADEGKHEFEDISQLAELRRTYDDILSKSKLDVIRYDFTAGDTPVGIFEEVDEIV